MSYFTAIRKISMADSDSGTHVTDISESLQDDFEARKEAAMMQEVTDTGHNFSRDVIAQNTTVEIHGENTSRNKPNPMLMNQLQRRNSTGSTPRLIRHVSTSRATSPTHVTQSRSSSPTPPFHVSNQAKPERRAPSPARFMPNCSVSPAPSRRISSRTLTPVRQLSSPAKLSVSRDNKTPGRVSRRRSIPTGRVTNHHASAMAAASVVTSPRRHRKVNGNIGPSRHLVAKNRARQPAAQKTVSYGGTLSNGDGEGFLRTLDSIPAHSGSRSAYDFVEANKRSRNKIKRNSRQTDLFDVELDMHDDEDSEEGTVNDKPWLPTGIYALFLITLWTAVVRLVDSVEENGPAACSGGEEARLWICAASFSLVQGLAEAFWQRKSLLKVLFSMACLFGYFIISQVQPLSCRVGADKVTEISKWQSAMNFFVSALLGIKMYKHIQEVMLEKKRRKARRKRSEVREEPDEIEGLPEGVV